MQSNKNMIIKEKWGGLCPLSPPPPNDAYALTDTWRLHVHRAKHAYDTANDTQYK